MTPDNPDSWVLPGRHWPRENRWGTERNWMMREEPWPGEDTELVSEQPPRPPAGVNSEASAAHTHSNTSSPAVGRLPHKLTADTSSHVWRWHGIGHDEAFVRATSAHPNVLHMAEALLGGPVKRPRRNRGICATLLPLPLPQATSSWLARAQTLSSQGKMSRTGALNTWRPRAAGSGRTWTGLRSSCRPS